MSAPLKYPATRWGRRAEDRLPAGHDYALREARTGLVSLELADTSSQPQRMEHQARAAKCLRRALNALEHEREADK